MTTRTKTTDTPASTAAVATPAPATDATSVATTTTEQGARRSAMGALPPHIQQALALRAQQNAVVGAIAELNWGKALDHNTRRAIADWGTRNRVDVTTEIHVLGGNVYLNAQYYLNRLAPLLQRGMVDYAVADHVHEDPRLERLGDAGRQEADRRLQERIRFNIPDKAAAAVIFRVKLHAMPVEVTGVKWTGNGTRKSDPVGDAFPVETAETRAARRALRFLIDRHAAGVPELEALRSDIDSATDDAALTVSNRIEDARALARSEQEVMQQRQLAAGRMPMISDYEGESTLPRTQHGGEVLPGVEPDPARKRYSPEQVAAIANAPDPYANDARPTNMGDDAAAAAGICPECGMTVGDPRSQSYDPARHKPDCSRYAD